MLTGGLLGAVPSQASPAPSDDIGTVEAQINQLNRQAEAATEAFNEGQIKLQAARRGQATAQQAVQSKSAQLSVLSKQTGALAAATYRAAGVSTFLSFVSSRDPQAFLDQASLLNQVAVDRTQSLDLLRGARKRLGDAQAVARVKTAQANAVAKQLQNARNQVLGLLAQRQRVLDGLKEQQRQELLRRQQQEAAAAEAKARQDAAALQAQQAQLVTSATSTVDIPASGRGVAALQYALSQAGKPYVWAGAGPDSYDCSGLTMWAFAKVGIALPHSAAGQYGYGTHIPLSQLQPGDLVFFSDGGYIGHVGIYYGNGTMVDAPHSGSTVGVHGLYGGAIGGTRL
jgi:cell wall-associated NlpC family hydrolase